MAETVCHAGIDGTGPKGFRVPVNHIVALSGGKDSTALALLLRDLHPDIDFTYVCTPTGRELPEMVDHWVRIGKLLGKPIVSIKSDNSFAGLVYIQKCLPNWRMRWCTRLMKIEPFERYIAAHIPCTVYVGIRADEVDDRDGVKWEEINGVNRRYPFVELGYGIRDILHILGCHNVVIPERTDCDMCFFQTLWEWYQFWKNHPDRWTQIEEWEKFTGHTLRSDQRDSWPASLEGLRKRFEAGDVPKRRSTMADRKTMCTVCAR